MGELHKDPESGSDFSRLPLVELRSYTCELPAGNLMDRRAMLRVDMGFYIGFDITGPTRPQNVGSMPSNIDCSSWGPSARTAATCRLGFRDIVWVLVCIGSRFYSNLKLCVHPFMFWPYSAFKRSYGSRVLHRYRSLARLIPKYC